MEKSFKEDGIVSEETFDALDMQPGEVNEKIASYARAFEELSEFNETNIMDRLRSSPGMHQSFVEKYFAEKRVLRKLKEQEEKLKDDWNDNTVSKTFRYDATAKPMSSLPKRPARITDWKEFRDLQKMIVEQEEVVEYLKEVSYILRRHPDYLKLFMDGVKLMG